MSERPSLLQQAGISETPASKAPAKASRAMSPEKIKLAAAVVLLVLAAVAIAWGTGAFRGGPAEVPPDRRARLQQEFEEQVKEEKAQEAASPVRRIEAGG